MEPNERQEQMLLYVAGGLEADEQRDIRARLVAGDPQAIADHAAAQATLAHLPLALDESVQPSPDAKDRLLQTIHEQATAPETYEPSYRPQIQHLSQRKGKRAIWPWALAALLAIVAGAWIGTYWLMGSQIDQQSDRIAQLQSTIDRQEGQLQGMRQRVNSVNRILQALDGSESRRVAMQGTKSQPGATGILVYDATDQKTLLRARGMQPAPKNQTYQLWLVNADQNKLSVGTFTVDDQGQATFDGQLDQSPGKVALAAVTNEPEGGSPQPTGEFQLLGKFQ